MELHSIKQRFGIIGNNPTYNTALSTAIQVASTDLTVLITGESGVGKEVFSKIIHSLSPRKHNQFIAINCGAIPEGTIDSELFGHEKGAFTGASDTRKGYFEVVNNGTIFLDEIGEMPSSTQSRLLRILESGEFIKVGSSKVQKSNVRVVAATNRNLLEAIRQGKFRQDLYYRLNTVPIEVPPLRERKEDIYLLFRKFSVDFSDKYHTEPVMLNEDAQNILLNYAWPGNIRELKNLAEQLSVLSKDDLVSGPELLSFLPKAQSNSQRMPILSTESSNTNSNFSERDLLYQVLFDMKKDINDLKKMIFQMMQGGKIAKDWGQNDFVEPSYTKPEFQMPAAATPDHPAIVINPATIEQSEAEAEVVEESLSIEEKEKELIEKALKKHKGKRKNAALDLGIAERTLYRKIKQYNIQT